MVECLATSHDIACPVCGNPCREPPQARYSAIQAATHFCPPTRDPERHERLLGCIRRLWGQGTCLVLRCRNCGFAFGFPHVGGDEEFYSILHEQKGYPGWKWDYDLAVEQIINKRTNGNIIDVGAGDGNFLARLPTGWSRYATEASDSNRAVLAKRSIVVFQDTASAAETHRGRFDTVTMFQVLEHVAEFRRLLTDCHRLLATGGYLVITVPDADAMVLQERLTRCADMPPNHINKFTPQSLTLVLDEIGFKVLSTVQEAPSWRHLVSCIHMRIQADAMSPGTIAAQIYKVSSRRLRQILLAAWAGPTLLKMAGHIGEIRKGGGFGIVAIRL